MISIFHNEKKIKYNFRIHSSNSLSRIETRIKMKLSATNLNLPFILLTRHSTRFLPLPSKSPNKTMFFIYILDSTLFSNYSQDFTFNTSKLFSWFIIPSHSLTCSICLQSPFLSLVNFYECDVIYKWLSIKMYPQI